MKEYFAIIGRVKTSLNGEVIEEKNLVVDDGKEQVAKAIAGDTDLQMPQYIAAGDSGDSANLSQSDLQGTELGRKEAQITRNLSSVEFFVEFEPGEATGSIRELGLFSGSSSGTMFSRVTPTERNKGEEDRLEITWTISIENV